MTAVYYLVLVLFLLLSGILCLIILVQESKSLGLGASFGGDAGESLFGTSTATVLKKFTAYLASAFMIACVFLSLWSASMGSPKKTQPTTIEETENLK
jgi:preprotein translocase subunit SecG